MGGESPGDLAAKRQGSFSCLVHASVARDRYHCLVGLMDSAFGDYFLGQSWILQFSDLSSSVFKLFFASFFF